MLIDKLMHAFKNAYTRYGINRLDETGLCVKPKNILQIIPIHHKYKMSNQVTNS